MFQVGGHSLIYGVSPFSVRLVHVGGGDVVNYLAAFAASSCGRRRFTVNVDGSFGGSFDATDTTTWYVIVDSESEM